MPEVLLAADMQEAAPARMWESLVDAAIALSKCAGSGKACRVENIIHPGGWMVITHVSVTPHDCLICVPRSTPEHLVSIQTLLTTERRQLVRLVADFLDHLHPSPALYVSPPLDSATGTCLGSAAATNPPDDA